MAEPAHAPPPPHVPDPADAELLGSFERDPLAGLGVERAERLPTLPSLDALHRLTDRDLPLDPFERDPLTGLGVELVERLPTLPSLAALHRLTDRDLPSGDGLPMPDGSIQWLVLSHTYHAFEHHFRHRSDVFVGCDGLLHAEGAPDARGRVRPLSLAPDVMVAFGVERRARDSYVIWQEGGPPAFVLEVASPSTWRRDRDVKPGLYASMGVREYFLYDPVGGRLIPRLQGNVLEGGAYRALRAGRMDNGVSGVWSEVLGLWAFLKGEDGELRWYDPEAGKELETPAEVHAARKAAEEKLAELEARLRTPERRTAAALPPGEPTP